MPEKILIVDDEKNIRDLLKFNLENEGYETIEAKDGEEALEKVQENIDLVILDLMLPEIDGLNVCKQIRNDEKTGDLPIIMLTAKSEDIDRIIGLELGADDYVTKPFNTRELIARIKALLRRISMSRGYEKEDKKIIKVNDLMINIKNHTVKVNDNEIPMTPKEFDLLVFLIRNDDQVFTRDTLLSKIWGYEFSGDTRTVDVHVRRLRKKIGKDLIKTVRGVGYKFEKVE
ncbi:MAG TPA: response regulator transcription factor [Halanaerobiales bacterium]|nr:response regulator transcription factor [Halanaerobiales bacterium]